MVILRKGLTYFIQVNLRPHCLSTAKKVTSRLASKYGLAADQTLEWEVVTGTGQFVKPSRTQNSDLYWALSGGGGGTYGVVWSLTAKAHIDIPVSAANISWTNDGISQDVFFNALGAYHTWAPSVIDRGAMPLGFGTNTTFAVGPITAPGMPLAELQELMKSLTDSLDKLGVNYTPPYFELFPGYLPSFKKMMPPIPVGLQLYGGRLIPRSVVTEDPEGLVAAFRDITDTGVTYSTGGINVNRTVTGDVYNSVLTARRTNIYDIVLALSAHIPPYLTTKPPS